MYSYSDCCTRQSSRVLARQYYFKASPNILAILFRRHRDSVFRLCHFYLSCRIDAEDATMEIFEYLQAYLQKYEIRHFYSWLMRFSRNHCLRRLEQKRRQLVLTVRLPLWDDLHPEARRQKEQKIERLHRAIDQLKCLQRDCILGFYFEERSYKEIALHLQLSPSAVKSHIQNGKRNLRNMLVEEGRRRVH
ncbi:MAG: sigma-70 family RNA polymerase sigma factor [Saprospiraceae bacterium]